jgi:hypothetical protein
LGPGDRIEGQLTFDGDVVVEGQVEGELRLTGLLDLRGSGAVVGNVRVSRLTVEDGATLHGNVRMGENGRSAAQKSPSPVGPAAGNSAAATQVASESEDGFQPLFDGTSKAGWRLAGAGDFKVVEGALEAVPDASGELGLLWHCEPAPRDFALKLEWRLGQRNDNSGVHIRFPDPGSRGYLNQAWVAVDYGFEVQIDEYGWPDRAGKHKTGAIYDQEGQTLSQTAAKPPGEWNQFEIRARGQDYTVLLNGQQVCRFRNRDRERGAPSAPGSPTYVGIQVHPPPQGQQEAGGRVAFRNIRIKPL